MRPRTPGATRSPRSGAGCGRARQRAVYVFLLDLVWVLPALLLGLLGFVAFFGVTAVTISAARDQSGGGLIPVTWVSFVCCGLCIGVLYYLVWAIFSPLMYQSAVAGRRDFSRAVGEGWTLARKNLGAMIIFWILLALVGFVLGALQQLLNALVSAPLMGSWFGAMNSMMQGFGRSAMPVIQTSGPVLLVFGLASAVLAFLINTFTQTLNLTLYSGVYEHLTGIAPAAPAPVIAPAPSVVVEPAPPALVVPPAPPHEDEPPPTL